MTAPDPAHDGEMITCDGAIQRMRWRRAGDPPDPRPLDRQLADLDRVACFLGLHDAADAISKLRGRS